MKMTSKQDNDMHQIEIQAIRQLSNITELDEWHSYIAYQNEVRRLKMKVNRKRKKIGLEPLYNDIEKTPFSY